MQNVQVGLKHYYDPKAFIKSSNGMQDVYKNIEIYNLEKKSKVLLVFNDVIVDVINKKQINLMATKLLIGDRILIISLVFITQ